MMLMYGNDKNNSDYREWFVFKICSSKEYVLIPKNNPSHCLTYIIERDNRNNIIKETFTFTQINTKDIKSINPNQKWMFKNDIDGIEEICPEFYIKSLSNNLQNNLPLIVLDSPGLNIDKQNNFYFTGKINDNNTYQKWHIIKIIDNIYKIIHSLTKLPIRYNDNNDDIKYEDEDDYKDNNNYDDDYVKWKITEICTEKNTEKNYIIEQIGFEFGSSSTDSTSGKWK